MLLIPWLQSFQMVVFRLLRWMQNLYQSILYAYRFSKAEQLVTKPVFENQKYERGGWLEVNIYISFYADNS
jgi:hypothetical protein